MDENRQRPPRKEENPVREWVSDNLRYLILAAVLIAIGLTVFFIVRNQYRKTHPEKQETAVSSVSEVSSASSAASSGEEQPEARGELVDGPEDITTVIEGYFDALNNADAAAAEGLMETMTEADRADISSGVYNRSYGGIRSYIYDRTLDNFTVVLVSYTYRVSGFDVDIPGLTEFGMVQQQDGSYVIASEETQRQYRELMDKALSGSDGKSLVENIRAAFEEVCSENPDLAAIIR